MSRSKKKNDTTADDSLPNHVGELTPEQKAANDKFDMGSSMLALYWQEPFYAIVYRAVHRVMTREIPTAGVGVTEDRPTLFWNPDFVSSLPNSQVMGLLKHEAMHLINNHCTTRRLEPHKIANWAADLSINCSIPEEELPSCGLVPGKPFAKLTKEKIAASKMTQEDVDRYNALSDLIKSLPPHKSYEWYFVELMKNDTVQQMVQEQEKMDEFFKKLAEALGQGQDFHEAWDEIDSEAKDLIDGRIKKALEEAVRHADNNNAWGSIPNPMREQLRARISKEIDWKQVLRSFIGRSRRADSKNSHKRINRKQPYIFPGKSRNYTANIAVYIDQSGSMSNAAISLLFGEMNSLARRTTFHVHFFDTEVYDEHKFTWKKGKRLPELKRVASGGTSFDVVVAHANAHAGDYDGVLILTDGGCSRPPPCRIKLGYVIIPESLGGSLAFEPRPGEVVIKMKENPADDS